MVEGDGGMIPVPPKTQGFKVATVCNGGYVRIEVTLMNGPILNDGHGEMSVSMAVRFAREILAAAERQTGVVVVESPK